LKPKRAVIAKLPDVTSTGRHKPIRLGEVRRDSEYFEGSELDLIYMARRLRDALRLEELLTAVGIDYLVETGTYSAGFIIRRELTGAFFYIAPAQLEFTRDFLQRNGFKPYQSD
jgi:hypothetical protein